MKTRVSVFESEIEQEILLIKNKLQNIGIESIIESKYIPYGTITTFQIKVYLEDETKAFELIDKWLQQHTLE